MFIEGSEEVQYSFFLNVLVRKVLFFARARETKRPIHRGFGIFFDGNFYNSVAQKSNFYNSVAHNFYNSVAQKSNFYNSVAQ